MTEKRQCRGHNRAGDPCRMAPIRGATVCRVHGGSAPQVKRKAEERLAEMVEPALTQLHRLMESAETESVKLAAVKDILDRAGYKPKERVQMEVNWLDELRARIDANTS